MGEVPGFIFLVIALPIILWFAVIWVFYPTVAEKLKEITNLHKKS